MKYQVSTEIITIQKLNSIKISTLIGSVVCIGVTIGIKIQDLQMTGIFNTFEINDSPKLTTVIHRKNKICALLDHEKNILILHPLSKVSAKWDLFLILFILLLVSFIGFIFISIFSFDFSEAFNFSSTFIVLTLPLIMIYGIHGYYLSYKTKNILSTLNFRPTQIKKIDDFTPEFDGIYPLNDINDLFDSK